MLWQWSTRLYKNQRSLATLSVHTAQNCRTYEFVGCVCSWHIYELNSLVFEGCRSGSDPRWNITWANTARNKTDTQLCPGVKSRGTRRVTPNGTCFDLDNTFEWISHNCRQCNSTLHDEWNVGRSRCFRMWIPAISWDSFPGILEVNRYFCADYKVLSYF